MAVQTFAAAPQGNTVALYRDWGKKLSDAMTAVGFLKTEDTGQIDWATVSAPATASAFPGYEIRAFTDAHQGQMPMFLKIEYGSGPSNASHVSIRLSVGRATDGAGTLYESTVPVLIYNSSYTTTTFNCYVSGDADRISFIMFCNLSWSLSFYIERVKDASGAATNAGITVVSADSNGIIQQHLGRKGLGFPYTSVYGCMCSIPYGVTSVIYNGNTGLFPVFVHCGYANNPDLGGAVYIIADIAIETDVELTLFSVSHNYKTAGRNYGTVNGNTTAKSLAVRYE
jgi:hypothetical protein